MKILQVTALILTALALVPGGAHLFALPNKIHLAQNEYFVALCALAWSQLAQPAHR